MFGNELIYDGSELWKSQLNLFSKQNTNCYDWNYQTKVVIVLIKHFINYYLRLTYVHVVKRHILLRRCIQHRPTYFWKGQYLCLSIFLLSRFHQLWFRSWYGWRLSPWGNNGFKEKEKEKKASNNFHILSTWWIGAIL